MSLSKNIREKRISMLKSLLESNPELSTRELSSLTEIPERTIFTYLKQFNLRKNLQEFSLKEESKVYSSSLELSKWKARYKQALATISEQEKLISKLLPIPKHPEYTPINQRSSNVREVVPVVVASDWHVEETVTKAITNGKNKYDLEVAESSIRQFFSNAIHLIKREQRDSKVETVVLALLGDFLNGVLREEDLQTNSLSSTEAFLFARNLIFSGVSQMAKETGVKIKVICTVGNHGRLTEKIFPSNQIHLSLEYLLYKILEGDFKSNPQIEWKVSESYYYIQEIFGKKIRFHHGHIFKFGGGIGGVTVPILRKIAQMNLTEQADLDVCGHFHTTQILPNALLNGSLVGANGYSMSLGLPWEPPRQLFFLMDSKYGRTTVSPIFIDRPL